MTERATQGHTYMLNGMKVMALESGTRALVARVDPKELWPLQQRCVVDANALRPLPMVYFGGQTPQ